MEHDWYLNGYGEVDTFRYDRYDGEDHNGPECRRCGWIGCQHCQLAYAKNNIYEEECPSNQLDIFSVEGV